MEKFLIELGPANDTNITYVWLIIQCEPGTEIDESVMKRYLMPLAPTPEEFVLSIERLKNAGFDDVKKYPIDFV